jgi:hypothetical protein
MSQVFNYYFITLFFLSIGTSIEIKYAGIIGLSLNIQTREMNENHPSHAKGL